MGACLAICTFCSIYNTKMCLGKSAPEWLGAFSDVFMKRSPTPTKEEIEWCRFFYSKHQEWYRHIMDRPSHQHHKLFVWVFENIIAPMDDD
jgi:hypothetical protein